MFVHKKKGSRFSLFISICLIVLLLFPASVFAEEVEPPAAEEETAVETTETVEEPSGVEEATVEGAASEETEEPAEEAAEETAEEETVEESTDEAEEPAAEETSAAKEDLSPIVEALDEAGAVLVDEKGEPLPLASVGAEDALETISAEGSDPFFKSGGIWIGYTHIGGTCSSKVTDPNNCYKVDNPIQAALDDSRSNGKEIRIGGSTTDYVNDVFTLNGVTKFKIVNHGNIVVDTIYLNTSLSDIKYSNDYQFFANNIYVGGGTTASIQDGIDIVSNGGTVNVAAGEYNEYLHITKDGVTVQGAGIDQSIIDLEGLEPYWHYDTSGSIASRSGVEITAYGNSNPGNNMVGGDTELIEDVTFSGFTVKNAGVNTPLGTPQYYDEDGDGTEDVHGINVGSGKNVTINDCKVEFSGDAGLTFGRARKTDAGTRPPSENPTIMNCIVSSNHETGINVSNSIGIVTISGNNVMDNLNPASPENHAKGICVAGRSNSLLLGGTINNNIVSGNKYIGIEAYRYTDGITINNNIVTGHNLHVDAAGIFLSTGWGFTKTSKNHTVQNNIVTGNIRGIIAYFAWGDNPGDLLISGNTISTDSGAFSPEQAAIKLDYAYNVTVQNNTISCDGPGIRILRSDSHNNLITGNTITNASIAGIMIDQGAHDNTFTDNRITNTIMGTKYVGAPYEIFRGNGVLLWADSFSPGISAGSNNIFHNNSIYGNASYGIENQTSYIVDATSNWWGDASGPTHALNPAGTGDAVSDNVTYFPWLGTDPNPLPVGPKQAGPGPGAGPGPFAGPGPLIPVTGGELVTLSCDFANTLQLPDAGATIFNQVMCGFVASLDPVPEGSLPGDLPDGSTFAAGLSLTLLQDGVVVETLEDGTITISFPIPEGMEDAEFGIMYWDAEAGTWEEISVITVADGIVTTTVDFPGTFILVTK